MPLNVSLSEIEQGLGVVRKVPNEPSVEVGESKEGLYFLLASWDQPLRNSGYLDRVHLNGVVRDTVAQKTAPMFACFGKIDLPCNDDISYALEIFIQESTLS